MVAGLLYKEVKILFNNAEKQIQKLLTLFKDFQVTDLIGFGRILSVEETEDFVDYCTNICIEFAKQNGKRRKELLKLAKDIKVANDNMVNAKEGA